MAQPSGPWGSPRSDLGEVAGKSTPEAQLACGQCGAVLGYAPGTTKLACDYCGFENEIEEVSTEIVELDLHQALNQQLDESDVAEVKTVHCDSCGASFSFDPDKHAGSCPFCGQSIVTDTGSQRVIKPAALMPFAIDGREARDQLGRWLKGLWFAPNKLKDYARQDGKLAGVYLPYWTFDSFTKTEYSGQRGDVYHETVRVRVVVNGKPTIQTKSVPKVRWRPAQGRVSRHFDDVLVLASKSLPSWITDKLEPWDLTGLKPYAPQFITGFQAEAYQVELADGLDVANDKMKQRIAADVRMDIGGDMQKIHRMEIRHSDQTYKHILLPLWLGAFNFSGKTFRVAINGRNGEVQGERPYSWIKIALAILIGAIVVGGIAVVFAGSGALQN